MTETISNRQFEIIEATGRILSTSGVSGLTIKNLAAEMQFSEAAIYRHFKSKEDIIIALLEYLAVNMDKRLKNAIHEDQSPEEKFNKLFQSQFSFFSQNPHFVVAVFSDGLMKASQDINQTILKVMDVKTKNLHPILVEGQEKKVFTNALSTDDLMHIVVGTFRLQMFKWRAANFNYDLQNIGNQMIQSLLTLIKNK